MMTDEKRINIDEFCVDAPKNDVNEFKAERKATDHEATNLLLGHIAGHLRNLVTKESQAYDSARRRHEEWREIFVRGIETQAKNQKVGAIIVFGGICIMTTIISVVVSLLL
jgi:hypothetical protein